MPKQKIKQNPLFLIKEIILGLLAIISVLLVLFEIYFQPTMIYSDFIISVDFYIAWIFLLDFFISFLLTKDRKKYWQHNWYFLFAAIPLTTTITDLLHGLRALKIIRIVRAGQHLQYSFKNLSKR